MRIAVVGTGYVGLVTSAGLAEFGNDVACVCEDEDELARLADGKVGMYEPGLPELVATNLKAGRIRFTADLDGAVKEAEVIILATPIAMNADGDADLRTDASASNRERADRADRAGRGLLARRQRLLANLGQVVRELLYCVAG